MGWTNQTTSIQQCHIKKRAPGESRTTTDLMDLNMDLASLSLQAFEPEEQDLLKHDMHVIWEAWQQQIPELDKSKLMFKPSRAGQIVHLFNEIIDSQVFHQELIDVMPYIDDYLEHMAGFF